MGHHEPTRHRQGALRKPKVCPPEIFDARVDFQTFDMKADPVQFRDYDFCWSACALEHLGSIEGGLAFIERSLETLKPAGWAIHTTELNTRSNDETIDHDSTVLFRRRDFAELAYRLSEKGHQLAPLDFNLGCGPVDRFVDLPTYRDNPHLQVAINGFSTTSYGLIIQRSAT